VKELLGERGIEIDHMTGYSRVQHFRVAGGDSMSSLPAAFHNTERCANNRIESDHDRLLVRLHRMWGLNAAVRRGGRARSYADAEPAAPPHYELGVDARTDRCVATAFTELAGTI
jgi:transposase-like protein